MSPFMIETLDKFQQMGTALAAFFGVLLLVFYLGSKTSGRIQTPTARRCSADGRVGSSGNPHDHFEL